MKKRTLIAILAVALVAAVVTVGVLASNTPLTNLFAGGFGGYTSDETQVLTNEYVSSEAVAVTAGETLWFGPCDPTQYFQFIGQDADGNDVTGKVRGKNLTVADEFNNGMVIYQYTVPEGVSQLVFTAASDVSKVYTVSKSELSELIWRAYWTQLGENTDEYVGESSYYAVKAGDKLYFGAITLEDALTSKLYDSNAGKIGTIQESDLKEIENFGGKFGIYCYTVPEDVGYVYVTYDADYEQYYHYLLNPASEETVVDQFIDAFGVSRPLSSTVEKLSGKTALFLGDSITFGARDRANIYGVTSINEGAGGWAARIGYYTGMKVTNNGVSGACISTSRVESSSVKHYIYNNLVATQGKTYDYVIMHGLFNDASDGVELGTPQGKANFDPDKADVTTYAGGLELLFYQARVQNPNAILGFIVNFHTDRAVDQTAYAELAIAICKDWGIPYLDLYNNPGFSVEFDDQLHPTSYGYDCMYTIVANWMATLEDGKENATAATVMSYNVYFGSQTPGGVADIADRYLKTAQYIAAEGADIVLMQEYTDAFGKIAAEVLTEYTLHGNSHLGTDEATYIAWKTAQYELVDSGCVKAPGDWCVTAKQYPRSITWVILKDKTTGAKLLVMDVHGQPDMDGVLNTDARTKTMELVVTTIAEIRGEHGSVASVVGGDFNMAIGSDAYNALTAGGLDP